MKPEFKITVLISGGGTTLKNLIDYRDQNRLDAEIAGVVSSNPSAPGNQFATDAKIPLSIIDHRKFDSVESLSDAIFDCCRASSSNLVVMGGFLRRVVVPVDFENRIINIHPALAPAYSGKGYYGIRVHRAVIDSGDPQSGCTVHFVDNIYDHGPIIAQQTVPVFPDDTPQSLQQRVFKAECELLPAVINLISAGRISIEDHVVSIDD